MFVAKVLVRLSTNKNFRFLLVDKQTRTFFSSGIWLFMLVDKLTSTRGMVANRYTDLNLFFVNCRGFLNTNTVPG